MNARRQHFVRAYLGDAKGNATQAAIAAGYSENGAKQAGSRLLTCVDVQQAIGKAVDKADLSTHARLQRLGVIADTTPESFTGSDVLKANELILKVNGALKDKHTDSRITVNIGFLTQAPTSSALTASPEQGDSIQGEVMALQPPSVNSGQ